MREIRHRQLGNGNTEVPRQRNTLGKSSYSFQPHAHYNLESGSKYRSPNFSPTNPENCSNLPTEKHIFLQKTLDNLQLLSLF